MAAEIQAAISAIFTMQSGSAANRSIAKIAPPTGELKLTDTTWVYHRPKFTLAASTTETLDLYDFGGATDLEQNTYANNTVQGFLLVVPTNSDSTEITVKANNWTSGFLTGTTDSIEVIANATDVGVLFKQNPAGWSITDSSDHTIDIRNNAGAASRDLELMIWGT